MCVLLRQVLKSVLSIGSGVCAFLGLASLVCRMKALILVKEADQKEKKMRTAEKKKILSE